MWSDSAKFWKIGTILTVFGNFLRVDLIVGKKLKLIPRILMLFWHTLVAVNDQIFNYNRTHWQHLRIKLLSGWDNPVPNGLMCTTCTKIGTNDVTTLMWEQQKFHWIYTFCKLHPLCFFVVKQDWYVILLWNRTHRLG